MPKEKKPKEKKEKPPKEKKSKKAPKEKKVKAPKVKGQKGEKKKKNPILLIVPVLVIAAAAVAVIFFLKGRGGGEDGDTSQEEVVDFREKLPQEYVLDGNTVPGLMPADGEEEVRARLAKTITYTYDRLKHPGSVASDYVKDLSSSGFTVVDEEFVRTEDRPDYTAAEGVVLLAKNKVKAEQEQEPAAGQTENTEGEGDQSQEEEEDLTPKVITVALSWAADACVVTVDEAEGKVTYPPKATGGGPMSTMTISEVEDYVNRLSPQVLGREGDSMERYNVYAQDGTVFVNNQPCIRVNVYDSDNPQQANAIAGSYLMTSDGLHLYRLDEQTKTVQELKQG